MSERPLLTPSGIKVKQLQTELAAARVSIDAVNSDYAKMRAYADALEQAILATHGTLWNSIQIKTHEILAGKK